jgi:hypothetical protein
MSLEVSRPLPSNRTQFGIQSPPNPFRNLCKYPRTNPKQTHRVVGSFNNASVYISMTSIRVFDPKSLGLFGKNAICTTSHSLIEEPSQSKTRFGFACSRISLAGLVLRLIPSPFVRERVRVRVGARVLASVGSPPITHMSKNIPITSAIFPHFPYPVQHKLSLQDNSIQEPSDIHPCSPQVEGKNPPAVTPSESLPRFRIAVEGSQPLRGNTEPPSQLAISRLIRHSTREEIDHPSHRCDRRIPATAAIR